MDTVSKKFRLREFQVYKDARLFSSEIKNFTSNKLPSTELYGLRSQIWRALDSIVLNIAEGTDRSTDKDFANFLNKSHSSLNEVVACLDVMVDNKYCNRDEITEYITKAEMLANQLTAFRNNLLNNPTK